MRQVNDPPITEADAYTAVMNQALHVGAPGVLVNDHDVEVEDIAPLHAQLVAGPANGTVALNTDGSFDYTPNADFLGLDQFTYAAVDHFGAVGSTATVSITVALKAVSQAVNGGDTVSTGTHVTSQDPLVSAVTSPSGATIRIAQGVIAGLQSPVGYTFLNQQINIAVLNPDGSELSASPASPIRLMFTVDHSLLLPGDDQTSLQVFRNAVRIPDCLGQSGIPAANLDPCVTAREGGNALNGDVRLTILTSHASQWNIGASTSLLGDAPVAQNDGVYQVDYQLPLAIPAAGVLANDYARNGLKAALSPGSALNGSVGLADNGAFTFTPAAGACGPASFKYRATDGTNSSNEATASILIDCRPRPGDDAVTVLEDSGTSTITVLANDVDPDPGQTLMVASVTAPSHGVAAVAPGGIGVTYTPAPNYFGADSFTYTVSDGHGGTAIGTVSITVAPVNDAPSFAKGADQRLAESAGPQTVLNWATNMSAGPVNEAGQALSFVVTNDNNAVFSVQPSISSTGTLTYALAANLNGISHVARVSVRLRDNGGTANGGVDTSDPQTLVISVIPGIYISDVMLAEGNSGDTPFTFTVSLAGASDMPVSASFAAADSTATAPAEYTAAAGTLTFAPGVVSLPVTIAVAGDTRNEDDETFSVNLLNAVNGTIKKAQGAGIIQNDDPLPTLTVGNATVVEGNSGSTNMTFTVTLSPQSGKSVTVNFATADGSALAPPDYTAQSGTLTYAPGVVTHNKTFTVNLSGAVNANIAGAQGIGTIVDDDTSLVAYSTTADFVGGTADAGAYYSETGNGEVMLTPTLATEFSGTALPSGWLTNVLITKGTLTVSNGSVKLQGTQITSTLPLISGGRSMEFAATFSGAPQQLAGLLLAQFNTKPNGTTVGLYARTINGLDILETLIPGNWFGAPHRFRIDWNATSVVYWIDGAKVAAHAATFPASLRMTMVGSDLFKSTGVLTIDWMRSTPYAAAGKYTSKVFDAGAPVSWLTMSWNAEKPAGTNIVGSYRTGNTPTPDATWTAFATVPVSGGALAESSRYIQYVLQESTTNTAQTPAVKDVVIAFNR
ncbi:MAG: hypothetical protein DMF84_18525 [Acidobacteria bacterium]|nr:MAG: hypothetical protein DMF84_18525 [Acidobacteriota bacterium]